MSERDEQDLERWAQRELRGLPLVPAPPSLVPRMLAALEAQARLPWWRCPLWTWPLAARVAFFVTALAFVAGVAFFARDLDENWSMETLAQAALAKFGVLDPLWSLLAALVSAATTMVDSLGPNARWIGGGLALAMWFACVGIGSLCYRVALSRR